MRIIKSWLKCVESYRMEQATRINQVKNAPLEVLKPGDKVMLETLPGCELEGILIELEKGGFARVRCRHTGKLWYGKLVGRAFYV